MGLTQHDRCPYKRKYGHRHGRGQGHVTTEAEAGGARPQAQDSGSPQRPQGQRQDGPPPRGLGGSSPLFWTSGLQDRRESISPALATCQWSIVMSTNTPTTVASSIAQRGADWPAYAPRVVLERGSPQGRRGGGSSRWADGTPRQVRGLTMWKGAGSTVEWQGEKAPAGSVSREHQCWA